MVFGALLAALSAGYSLLVAAALRMRLGSSAARRDTTMVPVTVLKPLCGDEHELYENLRSFCVQEHPHIQIIFGVSDAADPAAQVVQRLQREFPDLDLCLVVDPTTHGSNRKVGNLINMASKARHEYLLLADSDIRVGRDYVSRVVRPLLDPAVGIVTCLYRARPGPGLWSECGAMFIDEWFIPSVRVATVLGSQSFTSGATIGLRRDVLASIGGFPAVADQLADDFKLGEQVRSRGLRTVVSDVSVETTVDEPTLGCLARHQVRWLRTVRSVQPLGYAGSAITFSLPVAALGAALAGGTPLALSLLGVAAAGRLALHMMGPGRRRGTLWRKSWVIPLADVLLFGLWCWSFFGPEVTWRRERYRVTRDGSLRPVA